MSDQSARVIGVVRENSTALISGVQFIDETGAAVPAASLSALTLTLYDKASDEIINDRDAQDVLNANGVTVGVDGTMSWLMEPEDNEIVGSTDAPEDHVALFEWTWASGTKKGNADLIIQVLGVEHVP